MNNQFHQTQSLMTPQATYSYIPPGKYMKIDEEVYKTIQREPEKQVAYGSGVSEPFRGIYRGKSELVNKTILQNPNPIVNYGGYIYQQRTGYQGHQSNDMARLYY